MDYKELCCKIIDSHDGLVYVTDMETNEVIFANKKLLQVIGKNKAEVFGKPCYQALQDKECPCEFCTNSILSENKYYDWEIFRKDMQRYFVLHDKLLILGDRKFRVEVGTDITDQVLEKREIKNKLNMEKTLIKCIDTLNHENDVNKAINELLKIVGETYDGDRAYIFERCESDNTVSNTYEWCKKEIVQQLDSLQKVPFSYFDMWIERFSNHKSRIIYSLKKELDHDSEEYKILGPQNIDSLVAAPLFNNGSLIGFIGVDNPSVEYLHYGLLEQITFFIVNDLQKRLLIEKLQVLSYRDSLTGVCNRTSYIKYLDELKDNSYSTLGVIFIDINGLKKANDSKGHAYGDQMIVRISGLLKKTFAEKVFRIGGDEFVVICSGMMREEFMCREQTLRAFAEQNAEINFSLGAVWTDEEISVEKLIAVADKAMYDAKRDYYQKYLHCDESL